MGSQLFYVWAFSFGIHLQRSLAFLQNGNLERRRGNFKSHSKNGKEYSTWFDFCKREFGYP